MSTENDALAAAREKIAALVERFRANIEAYKSPAYNEARTRIEFINPFFEALGWDMDNRAGYAEAYKDVIHEDSIKVGGYTKAPDYCFRVGGQRKFFVEAKKPSVNMKTDPEPYYQLRRYAYSAKLPLALLTDFEELAVIDCRTKPSPGDKASAGRIRYWHFEEYLDNLEEIYGTFSKEAVLKGGFDRQVVAARARRGTGEVDREFLKEIEGWRELLARSIALRNPGLTQRQLNTAVQLTIDRIIFLRICEDRGIEEYGRLMGTQNGANIYARLCQLFQQADERYNSGLFHFQEEKGRAGHPDGLTLDLKIDDKVLKQILKKLYYPDCPYEFSVLPADILGQVYEQFLGKVIRLTAGHQAKVEDKPEVKKAGGVYYTPTYIVDYIVKNTVGRLLGCEPEDIACQPEERSDEGSPEILRGSAPQNDIKNVILSASEGSGPGKKLRQITPKEAAKLKILDPACGSGSFLIGAYEYLLDWHRDWYTANDPEKWAKGREPKLFEGRNGWQLTTAEKKRILLGNIHGVDIDPQAVEVTKLSLLLKVLEDESNETLLSQMNLFRERALPDLRNNIKCGNSLIGPDFYEGQQLGMLDEEEQYRINAFDWEAEFPEIMKGGGFDAVIGNPPYVRQESLSHLKQYFEKRFKSFQGAADLYTYFIEQGLELLRINGFFSMIVSSGYLRASFAAALRKHIRESKAILEFVDFGGLAIFENAKDTYVSIPLFARQTQPEDVSVCKIKTLEQLDLSSCIAGDSYKIPVKRLIEEAWSLDSEAKISTFNKIKGLGKPLGDYIDGRMFRGVTTGFNEAFFIDAETRNELISKDVRSTELIKPLVKGQDIRRWYIDYKDQWIIFPRRGIDIDAYPAIRDYIAQWKEDLTPKNSREQKRGRKPGRYKWYEIQDDVAYYSVFDQVKIVFPDIAKGPRFHLDESGSYLTNTAYALGTDDLYLLGILNSRVFWFAIGSISTPFGTRAGEYRYRLIYQYMRQVPIRPINFSDPADKERHDRMVGLVEQMLDLNKRLAAARTADEKTRLERQIATTDRQIDSLVYELYGLTDEEIRIVEAG